MPLNKHFDGHGEEVMASMKKTYGDDAKKVFYATENKRKSKGRKKKRTAGDQAKAFQGPASKY